MEWRGRKKGRERGVGGESKKKMLNVVFYINCRWVSSKGEISFAREITPSTSAADTVERDFLILRQKCDFHGFIFFFAQFITIVPFFCSPRPIVDTIIDTFIF